MVKIAGVTCLAVGAIAILTGGAALKAIGQTKRILLRKLQHLPRKASRLNLLRILERK